MNREFENRDKRADRRSGQNARPEGARRPGRGDGRPPRRQGPVEGGAPIKTARDAALKALQDVVRGDAYAAQALDRQLTGARLRGDDRRLAASIFYFAVENRLYIEHALKGFLEEKPEPVVTDILHIAAAQILFMDRVPDHAAVDEAVKQVRACRREGFSGLVNGVLRNLIRARDEGSIQLPDRTADLEGYLSVRYSVALPVVRRLIAAYGAEEAEKIAAYAPADHTQTIRPNRMRMDGAAFEAYLNEHGITWRRGRVPDAYIISGSGSIAAYEGYRYGDFSVQGESSMLAAQAVEARPGMQILDACAAPGGKTCLMAEAMQGTGRVYAWDVHGHRVELIRAAAKRLRLDNVRPSIRDARMPLDSARLSMDAVLVDAPCSGLGVIADKPDIKYRQKEEALEALPQLQTQILEASAAAVKVGGRLVYSTCTILPEENEAVVRQFLEKHPEFEPDAGADWLPDELKPHLRDGRIQILSSRDGLEGFFIARMRRKGV